MFAEDNFDQLKNLRSILEDDGSKHSGVWNDVYS